MEHAAAMQGDHLSLSVQSQLQGDGHDRKVDHSLVDDGDEIATPDEPMRLESNTFGAVSQDKADLHVSDNTFDMEFHIVDSDSDDAL